MPLVANHSGYKHCCSLSVLCYTPYSGCQQWWVVEKPGTAVGIILFRKIVLYHATCSQSRQLAVMIGSMLVLIIMNVWQHDDVVKCLPSLTPLACCNLHWQDYLVFFFNCEWAQAEKGSAPHVFFTDISEQFQPESAASTLRQPVLRECVIVCIRLQGAVSQCHWHGDLHYSWQYVCTFWWWWNSWMQRVVVCCQSVSSTYLHRHISHPLLFRHTVFFIIELINYLRLVCPPCLSDSVTINN